MADLNFDEVNYGISSSGVKKYISDIRAIVLQQTSNIIETGQQDVKNAIEKGWNGESKDKFLILFNKKCLDLKAALNKEYYDLENRLNELSNDFINQDRNMMIED